MTEKIAMHASEPGTKDNRGGNKYSLGINDRMQK